MGSLSKTLKAFMTGAFLSLMLMADISAYTVSKSFTATGAGTAIAVLNGDSYTYSVSGTFVGSVVLEKSSNGGQSWKIITTYSAPQSSITKNPEGLDAGVTAYRFRCSAYTSGTIVTSIANAVKTYVEYFDNTGKSLFRVDDNGATASGTTNSGLGLGLIHSDANGVQTSSSVVNADVSASAAIDYSKLASLPSGNFLVGNGSNVATGVALSGDVTITNAGVSTVANASVIGKVLTGFSAGAGTVTAADSILSAFNKHDGNIAAKISTTLASGNFLVGNGSNVATGVALSGDVTMTNAGVATVANSAVIAKVLTGYSSGAGTVASTDSILQAIQKLNGNTVAAASGVAGTVSTGTQTFTGAKTFETQLIGKGTTTNDSANAGNIGEQIIASVATGSAVSLSTGTAANVTSISLTQGDWDVSGCIIFKPGATTSITLLGAAISGTTGAVPAVIGQNSGNDFLVQNASAAFVPGSNDDTLCIPPIRVSLSGTTTTYLVGKATFSISTLAEYGQIRARRMR